MKSERLQRLVSDMKRDDARASHLAVGALLVITILYAATII
jgi:hypothetical protein